MNIKYKMGIWMTVVAVFASGFWFYIDRWLNYSGALTYSNWNMLSLVFFVFLISAVSISLMLFKDKYVALAILGLAIFSQLIFFGFTLLNLLGLIIFLLSGYNARARLHNELDQRIKFKTSTIIRNSIKPLILGIFLVVSFSAYQSSALESVKKMDKVPSIGTTFVKELVHKMIGRDYNLDMRQTDQVIDQTIVETDKQINSMFSPYLHYAPPVLAFVLFLILYGLNWIFLWLSMLLCVGVIATLRMMKFITIEEKDVKAEMMVV